MESAQHLQLIDTILAYIAREHANHTALAVLDDKPTVIGGEKPPRINGFVPDVFAVDVPTTMTIIGEAKTTKDLETARSRRQISAFLEFLRYRQSGLLILAVPWKAIKTARMIVAKTKVEVSAPDVTVAFLHPEAAALAAHAADATTGREC